MFSIIGCDHTLCMTDSAWGKFFPLEQRALTFTKDIRKFVERVPKTLMTFDLLKQVLRSSSSIGANYIEANECLGKRDFLMHLRISRKEAKETRYWLDVLSGFPALEEEKGRLLKEAQELELILGSIIKKSL